ncbi:hypothetical protein IGI04_042329, partial [Brassica rapa subsp. trilocularis]
MCTDMVHQLSKISTRTDHGKEEHADMCGQRADICTDRQSTDSLWLSKISQDSPRGPKSPTVHGKGQRAESKDQHAHMCVLMDSHRRPMTGNDTVDVPRWRSEVLRILPIALDQQSKNTNAPIGYHSRLFNPRKQYLIV